MDIAKHSRSRQGKLWRAGGIALLFVAPTAFFAIGWYLASSGGDPELVLRVSLPVAGGITAGVANA